MYMQEDIHKYILSLLKAWKLQEVLKPFYSEYYIIKALRFRNWALCLSRMLTTIEVRPLELRSCIKVIWSIPGNAEMKVHAGHFSVSSGPMIIAAKIRVNEVPNKWWLLQFFVSSNLHWTPIGRSECDDSRIRAAGLILHAVVYLL